MRAHEYRELQMKQKVTPEQYMMAHGVMLKLKQYQDILSTQEYKAIKGQALAGDIQGAEVGLSKLIKKRMGYVNMEANA